jgi:hypothetical protein
MKGLSIIFWAALFVSQGTVCPRKKAFCYKAHIFVLKEG